MLFHGRPCPNHRLPGASGRCLKTFGAGIVLLVSLFALAVAARSEAQGIEENSAAIPMRDGALLHADVLLPIKGGPFPVLVYRTPYGGKNALQEYTTFRHALERGYAVVVQDVRGRYASGGVFAPYQNEGRDGYDTIEWAAAQPWSNGKVGTFGLSYPGAVQWLAAVENPPHLMAMVPAMTFSSHRNFFYAGGAFDLSWIEWIWDNIAPDVRVKRNAPGPRTDDEATAAWAKSGLDMESALPLSSMDALQGIAPYYYEWLRHSPDDPWWGWADLRGKYGRTQAAILNLSGWYDDHYGPEGATTNFRGLVEARQGHPNNTSLLIGAWVHGVTSTGSAKAGDRSFPDAAKIDYDNTVLDWMDHYLRGIHNGVDRKSPVRYYVMGADAWRESRAWPPPSSPTIFYLGTAAPAKPGLLTEARPNAETFSSFVSDPWHPVTDKYAEESGAHDYRYLADRTDLLTFDTAPLSADTEVTGLVDSHIFISCDCRDVDVWVRLYDVAPDGAAWNEMSPGIDVQRASFREMAKGRQLLRPGEIYEIRVTGGITSNVFKKGHRIRVQVSGSFFPYFSRNLQSGELETVGANGKKATIRIHHDRNHASYIVLPVVE
jgi:putative CocE/NonD family hydrolase